MKVYTGALVKELGGFMAFETFAQFLQMGKHGLYVWSSYAFFAVSILGLIVTLIKEGRDIQKTFIQEGLK